jgi:hypothetical protein
VAARIAALYQDLIVFPPSWPTHGRHAVATDAADTTATELGAVLDDYLERDAASPHTTEHGWSIRSTDRHHTTTAALAALTEDHLTWWGQSGDAGPGGCVLREVAACGLSAEYCVSAVRD